MSKGAAIVESTEDADFLQLAGDIVLSRQAADVFATLAAAGARLEDRKMEEVAKAGVAAHGSFVTEAAPLVQDLFVEAVEAEEA